MKFTLFLIFSQILITSLKGQINGIPTDSARNTSTIIQENRINHEMVFEYSFNKKGIRDSFLMYTLTYNKLGDVTIKAFTKVSKSPPAIINYYYNYDINQHILKKAVSKGFYHVEKYQSLDFTDYTYDSSGNEVKSFTYNTDTSQFILESKKYDNNNNVVEVIQLDNGSPLYPHIKYTYNKENKIINADILNESGTLMYSLKCDYQENGAIKIVNIVNKEGEHKLSEARYDRSGKCTGMNYGFYNPSDNRDFSYSTEILYHTNGTLYQITHFREDKKVKLERHYYQMF